MGISAGMAMSGKIVFAYSIGNFPTLRCFEQIRNDVCYHEANVTVVTVGGGFSYGALGPSHHATEDLALMRVLPNMTVVAPGDPIEAAAATKALVEQPGPGYLRLGRAGEPVVHAGPIDFKLGKAVLVRDGADATLISTGGMLPTTVAVADALASTGINVRVLSMHTIKPIDTDAIADAARDTGAIVTIEEHSVLGGLGGAVAEVLAESDLPKIRFKRMGLASVFADKAGSQEYLRAQFGLGAGDIVEQVRKLIS
jgi:transketolase